VHALVNHETRVVQALIEKEWLHFGHKFTDRCGHAGVRQTTGGDGDASASLMAQATGRGASKEAQEVRTPSGIISSQVSPVFTQFVDAVWQLQQQYPRVFEFNARHLVDIHELVYSCQFGTFLGNCDKDRIVSRECRMLQ